MMHIFATSAYCARQVTGCGMPGWGWALILTALFIVVTIGTFATMASGRRPRLTSYPVYWKCSARHSHLTPEAASRCSAAQPR